MRARQAGCKPSGPAVVVDRESLDRGMFAADGGYQRFNKVFDGELDTLLGNLREAVWDGKRTNPERPWGGRRGGGRSPEAQSSTREDLEGDRPSGAALLPDFLCGAFDASA